MALVLSTILAIQTSMTVSLSAGSPSEMTRGGSASYKQAASAGQLVVIGYRVSGAVIEVKHSGLVQKLYTVFPVKIQLVNNAVWPI